MNELVVCSLEPWDEIWRRNQLFVDALLRIHTELRVLFVEPAADPLFDLSQLRAPRFRSHRSVRDDGRVEAFRPLKPLPRRLAAWTDAALQRQVVHAVGEIDFSRPILWINDVTYAPLMEQTGWPTVYDVTDDWLLAPLSSRELKRQRRLDARAVAAADEVVVCSTGLAESRGRTREVVLIPNGVDAELFRQPRSRPLDLPVGPSAIYVGTLRESRLDVDLTIELARALPTVSLVFVGPDALSRAARRRLTTEPNVHLLGARPYADIAAYLQHADVVIVPHLVSDFSESLDPIKAYEAQAVAKPTVATPVAGFRELGPPVVVVHSDGFISAVRKALDGVPPLDSPLTPPSWDERARAFDEVLERAAAVRVVRDAC